MLSPRADLVLRSVNQIKHSLSPINFIRWQHSDATSDPAEVEKFARLSAEWWDESGPLKALHSMNRIRVPWIRDTLINHRILHQWNKNVQNSAKPLEHNLILDVGCGAGILSEPLARLGAKVVGIDTVDESIHAASLRLKKQKLSHIDLNMRYINCPIENLESHPDFESIKFDAVVASEVIEHVADREHFLGHCANLLSPGGLLFLTTLNRTLASRFFAIFIAENVLGIVPKGIHDWNKFVEPDNLELSLERHKFHVKLIHGLCYNPITNRWSWIRDQSINYALCAEKLD